MKSSKLLVTRKLFETIEPPLLDSAGKLHFSSLKRETVVFENSGIKSKANYGKFLEKFLKNEYVIFKLELGSI